MNLVKHTSLSQEFIVFVFSYVSSQRKKVTCWVERYEFSWHGIRQYTCIIGPVQLFIFSAREKFIILKIKQYYKVFIIRK